MRGAETTRPLELAYGVLHEPPAPGFSHQLIVSRIVSRLDRHVQRYRLGQVVPSPVDVILDWRHALVVLPDVVFISRDRRDICTDRIWGAPELVIDVLSKATRRRDRTIKLGWYRQYDVRECRLVDPVMHAIEVWICAAGSPEPRTFERHETLRSSVLPRLRLRVAQAFPGD